jgi:hypothetical protein
MFADLCAVIFPASMSTLQYATLIISAAAQKSLALLQEVIFGALALLMMIGAWAIALVYREMIAPLQLKLVESRATIER